jgi:hypothetical protein
MFFPKGFSAKSKTPGVVLGQGWAGTHFSIEKYGARLAERGLVQSLSIATTICISSARKRMLW